MHPLEAYRTEFISYLNAEIKTKEPRNLYEPITYILSLGGKRLRPALTMMSAEIFGSDFKKALSAALAIEVFHNFSLIHDDIMDDAPIRRGKATVHEKWDVNTGILSGDAMLILAYRLFERYDPVTFSKLAQLFSKTAIEVCEGQQYDMDFETRNDVTISEYLKMIELKTAVLVGAALKMGGIIAGASEESQNQIYKYGKYLGIAFQLQDDYLDAFGDSKTFGKQIGGDIIGNKKTYLYLKAVELATAEQKLELEQLYSIRPEDSAFKINNVKDIFVESKASERTQNEIESYLQKAFDSLNRLDVSNDKKALLRNFGERLIKREV